MDTQDNSLLNKKEDTAVDENQTIKTEEKQKKHKNNYMEALKFLLFSISAGAIQILVFALLSKLLKWYYWPSYLIALTASVVWNFTFNRKFTFKSANNIPIAMLKVIGYYAVFTPLSTWWGNVLTNLQWNSFLVLGLTMVINFITEYLFDKFFVFNNKKS